ncbi:MAG: manganese efflux pump MntP family protein [Candidatus Eisenbacteria bacterium]
MGTTMTWIEILVLAIGLSMDAFAVSICSTSTGRSQGPWARVRLAVAFGIFQAGMPLLGWLLGAQLAGWFREIDHWIAFGLLAFIGARMIRSGLSSTCSMTQDPSRGMTLLMLAIATSIDAFGVGLSLAMLEVAILVPIVTFGVVTGLLSWLGVALGCRLGTRAGPRMEIIGGVLLLLIGARILWEHLLA